MRGHQDDTLLSRGGSGKLLEQQRREKRLQNKSNYAASKSAKREEHVQTLHMSVSPLSPHPSKQQL